MILRVLCTYSKTQKMYLSNVNKCVFFWLFAKWNVGKAFVKWVQADFWYQLFFIRTSFSTGGHEWWHSCVYHVNVPGIIYSKTQIITGIQVAACLSSHHLHFLQAETSAWEHTKKLKRTIEPELPESIQQKPQRREASVLRGILFVCFTLSQNCIFQSTCLSGCHRKINPWRHFEMISDF